VAHLYIIHTPALSSVFIFIIPLLHGRVFCFSVQHTCRKGATKAFPLAEEAAAFMLTEKKSSGEIA